MAGNYIRGNRNLRNQSWGGQLPDGPLGSLALQQATMDMRTRFSLNTTPFLSVYPVSPHLANRTRFPAALTALLIVLVLGLAACGPAESKSKASQAEADTLRIAQEYQANGDLDQARVAIDGISVANPR